MKIIEDLVVVGAITAKDFEGAIKKKIKEFEKRHLEVEVQYASDLALFTDMIIGRREDWK